VSSVLPLSEESWQVEWVEIIRARSGQENGRNRMKAVVTIEITPPKNKEMILKNPLGVYLKDISWTRQL
jgi:type IV secretion system protein VirB5